MGENQEVQDSTEQTGLTMVTDTQDLLLTALVYGANQHGLELGITLYVRGSVICGTLIGGKQYFNELSEAVKQSGSGNGKDAFVPVLEKQADVYADLPDDVPIGFIHLRGARTFVPGQEPLPPQGILWRGALASVDGWSLGEFSWSRR